MIIIFFNFWYLKSFDDIKRKKIAKDFNATNFFCLWAIVYVLAMCAQHICIQIN